MCLKGGALIIFIYKDGYYINTEKNTRFKEPALLINTENWSLTKYGEKKDVESIYNGVDLKYSRILIIFDTAKFKPEKILNYLESFVFNKDFVKFQILRLNKEVKQMVELNRKLANESCIFCETNVEELVESETIVYICPECKRIICEDCLHENYDNEDMQNAEYIQECPECGNSVKMLEITREDLDRVTFEDMFG